MANHIRGESEARAALLKAAEELGSAAQDETRNMQSIAKCIKGAATAAQALASTIRIGDWFKTLDPKVTRNLLLELKQYRENAGINTAELENLLRLDSR